MRGPGLRRSCKWLYGTKAMHYNSGRSTVMPLLDRHMLDLAYSTALFCARCGYDIMYTRWKGFSKHSSFACQNATRLAPFVSVSSPGFHALSAGRAVLSTQAFRFCRSITRMSRRRGTGARALHQDPLKWSTVKLTVLPNGIYGRCRYCSPLFSAVSARLGCPSISIQQLRCLVELQK